MKLSHKTVPLAVQTFDLFMWIKFKIELGEPVIDELNKIRLELEKKYSQKINEVTEESIEEVVKCSGKLFFSGQESWSRVSSILMIIVGEYFNKSEFDEMNLQEYLVQNLDTHNHTDKIPLVLSEIENISDLVKESLRRYESGIKYGSFVPKKDSEESNIARELVKNRKMELYDDLRKKVER